MIAPSFRARTEAALAAIEREEGVRVLLAVESGSRAWGFASRDSDYDVRFVFVRPLAHYLRVDPPRDTIERPIDDALDLAGWDLRKALGLAARSNATVLEWTSSPILYREDAIAAADLRSFTLDAAHLPALAHHYDRLARAAWSASPDEIRLKAYCYALRPVLALRWLRDRGTPPRMDLPSLRAGIAIPKMVATAIDDLLARKAIATEADVVPRVPVLESFLADSLMVSAERPPAWDQEPVRAAADELFRRCVTEGPGDPKRHSRMSDQPFR